MRGTLTPACPCAAQPSQLALHRRELEISRQYLPPKEEVIARRFMGDCLRELGRVDEAIAAYKVLAPCASHQALCSIRRIRTHVAVWMCAHVCGQKCVDDLEELDEPLELQRIYCNIGHCYSANAIVEFGDAAVIDAVWTTAAGVPMVHGPVAPPLTCRFVGVAAG